MLDVVEKFHNMGFLHRDIKPSNFRVLDRQVYLTDFGTVNPYKDDKGDHI
jgi:serine/threonine protein kinase